MKKEVYELLSKSKIIETIELLKSDCIGNEKEKQIVLISFRYYQVNSDFARGTIDYEDFIVTLAQVADSLLHLSESK